MPVESPEIRPIITVNEGTPIFSLDSSLRTTDRDFHLDNTWAKTAFMVDDISFDNNTDRVNRYWSSTDAKFTDTRLGCNIGINPKPQYTRYADVRNKGRLAGRNEVSLTNISGNYGMGRYYGEAIDDPSQTIYMQFGVEQFNGLTTFLSSAFNADQLALARTGRVPGIFYNGAKLAGTITAVVAAPAMAAMVGGAKFLNFLFSRPTSKFYTLKETMHTYWSTVQSLANNIAVNKGIFLKSDALDTSKGQRLGQPYVLDQEHMNMLSKMMPDIFPNSGGDAMNYFDVYAIANRAQRQANIAFVKDYDSLNSGSASDFTGYLKKEMTGTGSHSSYVSNAKGDPSFNTFLNRIFRFKAYRGESDDTRLEANPRVDPEATDPNAKRDPSWFASYYENLSADFSDGNQFAIFKVDHTGPQTDTIQHAVMESQISNKLNSLSSEMRQARFSFANGNLIGGIAGDAITTVGNAVKDVALGALDGITMGFSNLLPGLGGSGYIDIPKYWQSATVNLARSVYKMRLATPYGNPISQMQCIYIPLSMILAGAGVRSTGPQSYTSPFLCKLFDRGRCQIKLGMIEQITIKRGDGHLAFDLKGNAMAIEVTFTVVDLSSIMHLPVSSGSAFGYDAGLDEDNILSDYLAVLAGQDMYTQMYPIPKAKLRLAKAVMSTTKLTSPAYWASATHDSATTGMLKYMSLGSTAILEGIARGNETTIGAITN